MHQWDGCISMEWTSDGAGLQISSGNEHPESEWRESLTREWASGEWGAGNERPVSEWAESLTREWASGEWVGCESRQWMNVQWLSGQIFSPQNERPWRDPRFQTSSGTCLHLRKSIELSSGTGSGSGITTVAVGACTSIFICLCPKTKSRVGWWSGQGMIIRWVKRLWMSPGNEYPVSKMTVSLGHELPKSERGMKDCSGNEHPGSERDGKVTETVEKGCHVGDSKRTPECNSISVGLKQTNHPRGQGQESLPGLVLLPF